jgi:ClpP class serine protease
MRGNLPQFFAAGQNWHIETGAALAAISDFANDIAIISAGGKWSDTGAAQRKASSTITYEKTASGRVAIIPLDGVMRMSDGLCSTGIQTLSNEVRAQSLDHTVTAIIIEANTGGGEAIAGAELSNAIAEATKPVLFYAHFLASAGVMASLTADEVYAASAQSEVGSIGVKATVDNEMLSWYSKTFTDYYADTSGNKSEEMRGLQSGDPSKIIASLNKADAIFMDAVKKNRNLTGDAQTITETLSGSMFFAADAQKRGLIDGIKNKSQVIARAEQLAKQYSKTGRPQKGKKMTNILAGTAIGNILGIKESDEATDNVVLETLEKKFAEMEASASVASKALTSSQNEAIAATAKVSGLEMRIVELEAINVALSTKAIEINTDAETLRQKVTALEGDKVTLSTQLAALTLKKTSTNVVPEIADSAEIEKSARKAFGGVISLN